MNPTCKHGHDQTETPPYADGRCRACARARATAWNAANPEARKATCKKARRQPKAKAADLVRNRKRARAAILGLPNEDPPIGHPCEICNMPCPTTPHADHDHTTGRFRGWLCQRCNTALGTAEQAGWLEAAKAYLARAATLAVVAWLVGSTVQGNTRTCLYRDYTGRTYDVVQPAAEMCDARITVPSC